MRNRRCDSNGEIGFAGLAGGPAIDGDLPGSPAARSGAQQALGRVECDLGDHDVGQVGGERRPGVAAVAALPHSAVCSYPHAWMAEVEGDRVDGDVGQSH